MYQLTHLECALLTHVIAQPIIGPEHATCAEHINQRWCNGPLYCRWASMEDTLWFLKLTDLEERE